jgi:ABC-type lipoprotein export system ATPase subunit
MVRRGSGKLTLMTAASSLLKSSAGIVLWATLKAIKGCMMN